MQVAMCSSSQGDVAGLNLLENGLLILITTLYLYFSGINLSNMSGISCPLCVQTFSLATSPLSHTACVGAASGHLYFLDLNNLENLRIISRIHIHAGPVKHIV